MRGLKVCLRIIGVLCLLALVALFLPVAALESISNAFAPVKFPDSLAFAYVLRGVFATYAAVGVFYLLLARDPLGYGMLTPFSGAAAVFVGLACLVAGLITGVPAVWILGDAGSCTILGLLVLFFWGRARAEERGAETSGLGPQ